MEVPSGRREKIVRFRSFKAESPLRPLIQAVGSAGFGLYRAKDYSGEDDRSWRGKILDPAGEAVLHWNRIFLFTSLVALFLDPLYFYLPSVAASGPGGTPCVKLDQNLNTSITLLRTMTDLFFFLHVVVKLRTAYVAPSSRIFGRGELIADPRKIAWRYLRSDLLVDLAAALPLPQILIWIIIPAMKNSNEDRNGNTLVLIVLFQYIPRLYVIFPLSREIIKASGVVTKTAWGGAAYNLLLYVLASHVLGASWYLLSIERLATCWKSACGWERGTTGCRSRYFDCDGGDDGERRRRSWAAATRVFSRCDAGDSTVKFQFGIFVSALTTGAASDSFPRKYLYCLWWGLQNLSSYGQNLSTSTFLGETAFAILIAIVGLVLFAHLIGNMQTYLQSTTVRLEEWRLRRRDTEEWMKHRQLPRDLRERVRRFGQYTWVVNQGVDEEAILRSLPSDLRRDIKLHLCLDLVRRVPFFSQVDDQLLGAICERLVALLRTRATYVIREGDPVTEMVFVIRGSLESSTTGGGRTGFFNCITLRRGDFCGEELLVWALLPRSSQYLPLSTRTVRTLTEVEGFALRAEDLRFVANQFRRLHSKRLQHTFRFYSHHWRSWAACFIQAAWRRFKRRRLAREYQIVRESRRAPASTSPPVGEEDDGRSHGIDSGAVPALVKPEEPDFSRHCED